MSSVGLRRCCGNFPTKAKETAQGKRSGKPGTRAEWASRWISLSSYGQHVRLALQRRGYGYRFAVRIRTALKRRSMAEWPGDYRQPMVLSSPSEQAYGARNQICKSVGIRNQMVGYVFEVELQFGLKSAELGSYYAVKGPFGSRHCVGDEPISLEILEISTRKHVVIPDLPSLHISAGGLLLQTQVGVDALQKCVEGRPYFGQHFGTVSEGDAEMKL